MSATRAILIVDGKLEHQAITAELRRCLDTVLRKARFELNYEIRAAAPAAASLENPEVVVIFRGRDQDLLLERNAELFKALEHLALRPVRRRRLPLAADRRVETLGARGRRPRSRNACAVSLQRHGRARTPHPAPRLEGRTWRPNRQRGCRRRPPGSRLSS
jgi:hypothetical protein